MNIKEELLFNYFEHKFKQNEKSITFSLISVKLRPIASTNGI